MRWNELSEENCSMARTVWVIGDRWTLLILRDCFLRVRRFEDFQQRLGITRPILASRLKRGPGAKTRDICRMVATPQACAVSRRRSGQLSVYEDPGLLAATPGSRRNEVIDFPADLRAELIAAGDEAAGDDLRLDLGGALEDVEDAGVAQDAADRVFEGIAVAAVDLQSVVGV